MKGSCHAICTREASATKMAAPISPQAIPGTCWKWSMAGPVICASKRNEDPSTCSPTRNPSAASIATRPCVISTSAYRCASVCLMSLKKPNRSTPSGKGGHPRTRPAFTALARELNCSPGVTPGEARVFVPDCVAVTVGARRPRPP